MTELYHFKLVVRYDTDIKLCLYIYIAVRVWFILMKEAVHLKWRYSFYLQFTISLRLAVAQT